VFPLARLLRHSDRVVSVVLRFSREIRTGSPICRPSQSSSPSALRGPKQQESIIKGVGAMRPHAYKIIQENQDETGPPPESKQQSGPKFSDPQDDKEEEVIHGIPVGEIRRRWRDTFLNSKQKSDKATPVVFLTTGALNPVHKSHVHQLLLARDHFDQLGTNDDDGCYRYKPVAGLLSPTHDIYVCAKLGKKAWISQNHRLEMVNLAAQEFSLDGFVMASAWETMQNDFCDFPQACRSHQEILRQHVAPQIEVVYCCGSDHALKCGLNYGNFPYRIAVVERSDSERSGSRMREAVMGDTVHLVQARDGNDLSSTAIREKLASGQSVAEFTGENVERYLIKHKLMKRKEGPI
jgi:nicotinic acid mononucleotide adenylyltransferase